MNAKSDLYKKSSLRKWAEGKACTIRLMPGIICKNRTETCVLVHPSKVERLVKGTAMKYPDFLCAIGCFECHDVLDNRTNSNLPESVIQLAFWQGHAETMVMAHKDGELFFK